MDTTFFYGKLGEVTKNIRTFAVPCDDVSYTFVMEYEYDSWNRIQSMTYPDGEVVSYQYDKGGMLKSVTGVKNGVSYKYIDSIRYNKFELKDAVYYGNGTHAHYTYDTLQRLSHVVSYTSPFSPGGTEMMQDLYYTYDSVSNITDMVNHASQLSNGLGGSYDNHYVYDNLYRLSNAEGHWHGISNLSYNLSMDYHDNGRVGHKSLTAGTLLNGNFSTVSYGRKYHYNTSSQKNTIIKIDGSENHDFQWDATGNMIYHRFDGIPGARFFCWDEENRLQGVKDKQYLSFYQYDANGERTYKLTGGISRQNISGRWSAFYLLDNPTLYPSPYIVVTRKGYTKHYYAENERIASRIGGGGIIEIDTPIVEWEVVRKKALGLNCTHLKKVLECLRRPDVSIKNTLKDIYKYKNIVNQEKDCYWYHPDHLGSSSWITYSDGSAVQHLHYLPFGEDFVNQRTSDFSARHTFSAKERDTETGYSVTSLRSVSSSSLSQAQTSLAWHSLIRRFGSRYYSSDLSIWLSVDPMSDKYPSFSPYVYCANNPIKLVDPNGEEIDWVEKADGTIYWDDNATSQETTKAGEKYLGKNVLVATHGRDEKLNESVNGATFELYLESDRTGPTASIVGNTVPCDVDAYGTLPEGLYDTKYNGLYNGEPSLRILQKEGESYYDSKRPVGDLPTVKGNPNNPANKGKDVSKHIMNGILFHLGNFGRESLTTSAGSPITEGCQTGKHGAGSRTEYHKFATNFVGKNGIIYYLRANPQK